MKAAHTFASIFFLLALVPLLGLNDYLLSVLILILMFSILAVSLDLLFGYCGQASFAHGAFYGIGAYTSAILYRDFGLDMSVTLPLGAVSAGLFGLMLGVPSLRLGGHYLAIVTIAFQTIVFLLISTWTNLTGGQFGIELPRVSPFASFGISRGNGFYYLSLIMLALCILLSWRLVKSRIGQQWLAIRDDEMLARAVGLNTTNIKLFVFVVSAAMAGAAGVINVYYLQGAYPQDFAIITSATVVAMVIVGGRASIIGPVLGAIFFTAVPEVLRGAADYKLILYGLSMMAAVVLMPAGLVGLWRSRQSRVANATTATQGER